MIEASLEELESFTEGSITLQQCAMCKVRDIPHGWFKVIFWTLQDIPTSQNFGVDKKGYKEGIVVVYLKGRHYYKVWASFLLAICFYSYWFCMNIVFE